MRLDSCLRSLEALARAENSEILNGALQYYRSNKKLTPKQAFVVFWQLQKHCVDHDPSFFFITLRKKRYHADLVSMETSRVHFFWRALTPSQRKHAIEAGHQPPTPQPKLVARGTD
jgi:hypothetical protein